MKRTLVLVIAVVLATPTAGLAQQQPEILELARRAARGMELQPPGASVKRRSIGRTWAGVGMVAVGALLVTAKQTTRSCRSGSCTRETEWYKPLGYPGVALVACGGLLATLWSDVPGNPHIDFIVTPDRMQVGKTFGF